MALSEHRRHRMYRKLEEVMGEEAAGTLIEHLPRATWADLTTKAELLAQVEGLEERIMDRIEALLERTLHRQTRAIVTFMAGQLVAVAAIVLGVARA